MVGTVVKINGEEKINLASNNFLGFVGNEDIKVKFYSILIIHDNFFFFQWTNFQKGVAKTALRSYGVGSCGPPGFYGTIGFFFFFPPRAKFI